MKKFTATVKSKLPLWYNPSNRGAGTECLEALGGKIVAEKTRLAVGLKGKALSELFTIGKVFTPTISLWGRFLHFTIL